jgi:hypothetical protein
VEGGYDISNLPNNLDEPELLKISFLCFPIDIEIEVKKNRF